MKLATEISLTVGAAKPALWAVFGAGFAALR